MNKLDREFLHHTRRMSDGEVLDEISDAVGAMKEYEDTLPLLKSKGEQGRIFLVLGHIGVYTAYISKLQMVLDYRRIDEITRDTERIAAHC